MNIFYNVCILIVLLLVSTSNALALTIDFNLESSDGKEFNVGDIDSLVAEIDKTAFVETYGSGNGDANELQWINDILDPDASYSIKYDVNETEWYSTSQTDVYAHQLDTEPDYYLIKTGDVDGDQRLALYSNVAMLDWAVINFQHTGFKLENIGKVSHIREIDGTPTPVPEPANLLLFFAGILGLFNNKLRKRYV